MKPKGISLEDYEIASRDYLGWCTECNDFTRDRTEGDAEDYDCPVCGQNTVIGADIVLMSGLVS